MEFSGHEFKKIGEQNEERNTYIQQWRTVRSIPYEKANEIKGIIDAFNESTRPLSVERITIEPTDGAIGVTILAFNMEIIARVVVNE